MQVSHTAISMLGAGLMRPLAHQHHRTCLATAAAQHHRSLCARTGAAPQTTTAGQHHGATRRRRAATTAAATPGGVLTTGNLGPATSLIGGGGRQYADEALFEPSNDLRELAAAQLHSLFAVLARMSARSSSGSSSTTCNVKACVYARRADSLDTPNITLQRIACCKTGQPTAPGWPGAAAAAAYGDSSHHFEELDELLTLHRAAWEPGWPGVAGDPETSLINEEVVLLPRSNLLVLPLAEAGALVGLLVVEVAGQHHQQHASSSSSSSSSSSDDASDHHQQQQQTVWEPSPVLGLSEDVLWALRMAVPPLAKACAMELRTALAGAQVEARQALARSLLSEARGPLKVLGTFGSMLSPRLKTGQTGEPEQDMADGMLAQGQRLADVVAQLEAALRPAARPAAAGAAAAGALAEPSYATRQEQPWRQQLALPQPATRSVDDGDMSDDDSWAFDSAESQQQQQQQQQVAAGAVASNSNSSSDVTSAAWRQQGQRPQMVPVGSSTTTSSSQEPPSHPERAEAAVQLVPAKRTADSLEASTRDIRWTGIDAPASRALSPSGGSGSSSSSSSRSAYTAADGSFDAAARTIDLEPVQTSGAAEYRFAVPLAAGGTSSRCTAATQQQQQQQQKRPAAVQLGVCNVVEVLNLLLAAAAKLAAAQGINLIASEPLDPAISSSASSSASNRSGSSSALTLLLRPVRPLMAGVAVGACRRVLGYCIDVALQCTPRGGQLCVTARASSGGVEVSVMHSGRTSASRLHTSTAALDAAARLGPAAAAAALPPAAGATAGSRAAAGRAGPRRSSKKRLNGRAPTPSSSSSSSTSTSSSSSSSSSWSRGMQELSSSAGLRGGSSLITLDLARQILHTLGGRLQLHERQPFMNAITGQLEVGSNIEVWLPAVATAAAAAAVAPGAP